MNFYKILILFVVLVLTGCSVNYRITKDLSDETKNPYFSGLVVYDTETSQYKIAFNAHRYFTPASTVKLFTLYASLHYLSDSIATLSYYENDTALFVKPLADPTFLHDSLPNATFDWLNKKKKKIILVADTFEDAPYGEGWQWDDYPFYYLPEKSLFPIYANLTTIKNGTILPNYFQPELSTTNLDDYHRDFNQNKFYFNPKNSAKTRKIPFKTDLKLSVRLLADTLKQPVTLLDDHARFLYKPYISTPTLPIYHRLMDESENFLAEQLFLIIAKQHTQQYKVSNSIRLVLDSLLTDIPDSPRWVDASGLSRYNLFTPMSMVYVLKKMTQDFGAEKVKQLLPHNGTNGLLQKWYPAETTYLYAKTGSLSNLHGLCGYLITKRGKLLLFSYMNNNYQISSPEVRSQMNRHLQLIYEKY